MIRRPSPTRTTKRSATSLLGSATVTSTSLAPHAVTPNGVAPGTSSPRTPRRPRQTLRMLSPRAACAFHAAEYQTTISSRPSSRSTPRTPPGSTRRPFPGTLPPRMRRIVLATLLTAAPTPAQGWNVPPQGAITYTRTTERFTVEPPPRFRQTQLVAGAEDGGHEWRHFACPRNREPLDWEKPGFADGGWLLGRGEFASDVGARPEVRTNWQNELLLLRTTIDFGKRKPKALLFRIHHDDGVTVFGNGTQLLSNSGYGRDRHYVVVGDPLDAMAAGENVIAVRGENIGGYQCLDVAITVIPTLPPGVRTAQELLTALLADRDVANRVRGDLFGAFRPPALLLHGELDAAGQRLQQPPGDLREIAFWAACDLQRGTLGGSFSADIPRLYRLGDLQLRGRVAPVDASGWQELDLTVKTTAEPDLGDDSKRFVAMFVKPHQLYGFDGRLRIRRRLQLDGERTRIAECRTELEGRLLRGKDYKDVAALLRQDERYVFAAVRDNQDAAFRLQVAAAIDRGTAFLKQRLAHLDAPLLRPEGDEEARSYHSGRLALCLLAMIKGGVPKDDPVLLAALRELRGRTLIDTYSLGNALMVLDAFYAPASEFADLKQGRLERAQRRQLPEADLALARRWCAQLLDNVDTRVDTGYALRFNYVRDARYDHSVNQYGLLGLYSAHLCGIDVSASLWEGAANHLIAAQCAPRGTLALDLTDFRTLARLEAEPDAKRTGSMLTVHPAGWNYIEPKDHGEDAPTWGSMTCAGITGLAISQAALRDGNVKRIKLQNDASAARNAAFGWLAQHLTLRCHPGAIVRQQSWFFYYLYGLERAALLSNVARIQGRDWYFEGAMVLCGSQTADGAWPAELHPDLDLERTAMAVLFLKRGTTPVLTGQ